MYNKLAVDYIKKCQADYSQEEIVMSLLKAGYPHAVVMESINEVYQKRGSKLQNKFSFKDYFLGILIAIAIPLLPVVFFDARHFVPYAGLIIIILAIMVHRRNRALSYGLLALYYIPIILFLIVIAFFFFALI